MYATTIACAHKRARRVHHTENPHSLCFFRWEIYRFVFIFLFWCVFCNVSTRTLAPLNQAKEKERTVFFNSRAGLDQNDVFASFYCDRDWYENGFRCIAGWYRRVYFEKKPRREAVQENFFVLYDKHFRYDFSKIGFAWNVFFSLYTLEVVLSSLLFFITIRALHQNSIRHWQPNNAIMIIFMMFSRRVFIILFFFHIFGNKGESEDVIKSIRSYNLPLFFLRYFK